MDTTHFEKRITVIEAALLYYDAGSCPVRLPFGTKVAADPWAHLQKRRPTREEVLQQFEGGNCNVGLIMGSVSGQFALDSDGEGGKRRIYEPFFTQVPIGKGWAGTTYQPRSEADAELLWYLCNTQRTLTPSGGRHLIFAYDWRDYPDGIRTRKLWQGLYDHEEVRIIAEGGYVVAPPSTVGGRQYIASSLVGSRPLAMPRRLIDYMLAKISSGGRKSDNCHRMPKPQRRISRPVKRLMTGEKIEALIAEIGPDYTSGHRDEAIVGIVGWLAKEGYSQEGSEAFVRALCNRFNDEQLQDRLQVVADTFRKDPSALAGYTWLKDRFGGCSLGS